MIADFKQYLLIKESNPIIAEKLKNLWGKKDFYVFMDELLQERTRPLRTGFPSQVLMALSDLSSMHDLQFPELLAKGDAFWQSAI